MSKIKKVFMPIIVLAILMVSICSSAFVSSGVAKAESDVSEETVTFKTPNCEIYPVEYTGIKTVNDLATETSVTAERALINYQKDVDNGPAQDGVIISPFWQLEINDTPVTVYASRTAFGIHSFVYLDVEKEADDFALNVTLTGTAHTSVFKNVKRYKVEVLPLSSNVAVESDIDNKTVKAVIEDFGSFSFAFKEDTAEALTIFVTEKQNTSEIFGDKTIQYIEPGDYSTSSTYSALQLTEANKVYYFRKGRYVIDQIKVTGNNSVVYFESGFYGEVVPVNNVGSYWMQGNNLQNVTITGRGLFDASACCGSELTDSTKPEWYLDNWSWNGVSGNKGGLVFSNSSYITLEGVTVINSQTWTCCFNDSNNVHVNNVMLFAFRVFADGVMLANCQDSIIENSFIRTGDDAFETKSTTENGKQTNNILFRNNAAWTDKAVAYGCIYESRYDQSNVRFENCSVGFASGSWSNHLGSCVIQLGEQGRTARKTYNVTFENIEIYKSNNVAFINCYIGGSGGAGDGQGTIEDIYFKNITCKINKGAGAVNFQTYDSTDCFINEIYLENIYSNGTKITYKNFVNYFTDNVVGGYDLSKLRIDGETPLATAIDDDESGSDTDNNKSSSCFGDVATLLPVGLSAIALAVTMLVVKKKKEA